MLRQLQIIGILLTSLLICVQRQCNAATTPFASRRAIIVPQLQQINTSSSALGEDDDDGSINFNFKTRTSSYSSRLKLVRGGNIILSSYSILSTITTIIAQSLNVATAAFVGSGYVGCYIASLIIQQLQQCKLSNIADNSNGNVLGKWKWTILATITHILHHNHSSSIKNPTFLATLWIYSHLVNPTLGGLIGCTHVLLGGLSSLLGSQVVINRLSDLMDVRLPPLDEDGNMSYNVDNFDRAREESKSVLVDVLVRVISSLTIFTSFPRDCLSLYLGVSAFLFLTWASSSLNLKSTNGMLWKVVSEQWMPWWIDGLFGDVIGEDSAADVATYMVVDTKTVTMRLFTLHWIIMLVKGTTALLLQL
eukprot:scaffold2645_cov96-Skeletonema_dohrnii-CCMP3373.AAC.6